MKVSVHHVLSEALDKFEHVATVDVLKDITDLDMALDYAWRWTNNINGSWSKKIGPDSNENVTVINPPAEGEMGLRSSMMGDLFEMDGTMYSIQAFGFTPIDQNEGQQLT